MANTHSYNGWGRWSVATIAGGSLVAACGSVLEDAVNGGGATSSQRAAGS
jgi:hypothetical protein